uniref:Triple QxxK/R motif-containing protein n=1 Tax=Sinocyclocheilus anshuiensis TaxID=1608454 RepID=A0A671MIK2_9TELE
MGKKDASSVKLPVDQYRKQIGKQDYKKTKPALRATRLKAEAKRSAPGIRAIFSCCACLAGGSPSMTILLSTHQNAHTF